MKKTEITLVFISLIAAILRLFSIEGGILFSTIFLLLLSLFYLFFGFLLFNDIPVKGIFKKTSYRSIGWKRLLWAIVTGFAFMITIPAILFALNKWPGAAMLLTMGILMLLPLCAVSLIRYIPRPLKYYSGILIRSGILLLISFIFLLT